MRWIAAAGDERWAGALAAFDCLSKLRAHLASSQAVPASFTWLVRADEQIERSFGDRGFLLSRFAAPLDALASGGDDVGLHTHLFRLTPDGWVTDNASPEWRRECVERGVDVFLQRTGRRPLAHSFGDRAFFADCVGLLDGLRFAVDLTVESGLFARPAYRDDETLLGVVPDHSACPRTLWRPSAQDWTRQDAQSSTGLRLLPVATRRLPLWMEPGRRLDLLRRRLLADPYSMDEADQRQVRLCASHRAYVFRTGCGQVMREDAPSMLHLVLRASAFAPAASRARIIRNLGWIARGGLGVPVEFVSATGLLAAVDREEAAALRTAAA